MVGGRIGEFVKVRVKLFKCFTLGESSRLEEFLVNILIFHRLVREQRFIQKYGVILSLLINNSYWQTAVVEEETSSANVQLIHYFHIHYARNNEQIYESKIELQS